MKNSPFPFCVILGTALAVLMASPSSHAGEFKDCKAEFRKCKSINGACVWLGVPLGSSCDKKCQMKLMHTIQNKFDVGIVSSAARKEPTGCVGFRPDIDGTEKGAMCLANLLGYRFDPIGCNVSGWPYNVRTD
jgi:hypothetical protein